MPQQRVGLPQNDLPKFGPGASMKSTVTNVTAQNAASMMLHRQPYQGGLAATAARLVGQNPQAQQQMNMGPGL